MARALTIAAFTALALTACAKSEDADIKVLRNDVSAAPPSANLDEPEAAKDPLESLGDAAIAAAIRADADANGGFSESPRWLMRRIDLNGDGTEEAVAYVIDRNFCGSGGCSLYVLTQQGGAWTISDEIGPAQLPIWQLDPGADGWAALGVSIRGGGAKPAMMSVPHDSNGYADNPTVAPARSVEIGTRTPILDEQEGTPLPAP